MVRNADCIIPVCINARWMRQRSSIGGKADTAAAGTTAESGAAESSTAAERTNFDEEVELLMYCIGDEGGIYADEVLDNLNAMLKEKSMQPSNRSWYPGVSIRKRCR